MINDRFLFSAFSPTVFAVLAAMAALGAPAR
jgi:hypothetical protein